MPKDRKGRDLPSTIERSPDRAQRTWEKAHESAVESYGEGERAHRTAFSALKHSFEKVGDHWEPKDEKGPSDPRAKRGSEEARKGRGRTYGGVDVEGSTKQELVERAKRAGITGYSKMNKDELGRALQKASGRETAKARERRSA